MIDEIAAQIQSYQVIIKNLQDYNPKSEKSRKPQVVSQKVQFRERLFEYDIVKYEQRYDGEFVASSKNGYFAIYSNNQTHVHRAFQSE